MNKEQTLFGEMDGGLSPQAAALCHLPIRPAVRRDAAETSRAAARSMVEPAGALRTALLKAFVKAGNDGLTDLEGESVTGVAGSSYRPRRIELQRLGLIELTNLRRRTPSGRGAAVFRATTAATMPGAAEVQTKTAGGVAGETGR